MAKRKHNHPSGQGPATLGVELIDAPKLTLGVELPPEPSAAKDWADDDDTTGVGPVDDLQPIGRVTPVPDESPRAREYSEADEEPTLLGPFHEPPGPLPSLPVDNVQRVAYIDATAIALYARGFPLQNVYAKAAALWEQRQKEGFK